MAKGKKTGGRVAGVPNKTTTAVKEALELAFQGIGGVPALQTWAETNATEFYKIWSKLLPAEVKAEVAVDGQVTVILKQYSAPRA